MCVRVRECVCVSDSVVLSPNHTSPSCTYAKIHKDHGPFTGGDLCVHEDVQFTLSLARIHPSLLGFAAWKH